MNICNGTEMSRDKRIDLFPSRCTAYYTIYVRWQFHIKLCTLRFGGERWKLFSAPQSLPDNLSASVNNERVLWIWMRPSKTTQFSSFIPSQWVWVSGIRSLPEIEVDNGFNLTVWPKLPILVRQVFIHEVLLSNNIDRSATRDEIVITLRLSYDQTMQALQGCVD